MNLNAEFAKNFDYTIPDRDVLSPLLTKGFAANLTKLVPIIYCLVKIRKTKNL